MKTLNPGEMKAWQSGHLGCLVWHNKQPVLILSTHHEEVDEIISFDNNSGLSQPPFVDKPQVVLDYNVGKTGVDTVDQLRQYYAMQRKSRKDWPSPNPAFLLQSIYSSGPKSTRLAIELPPSLTPLTRRRWYIVPPAEVCRRSHYTSTGSEMRMSPLVVRGCSSICRFC